MPIREVGRGVTPINSPSILMGTIYGASYYSHIQRVAIASYTLVYTLSRKFSDNNTHIIHSVQILSTSFFGTESNALTNLHDLAA